jgi:hypothetical protein
MILKNPWLDSLVFRSRKSKKDSQHNGQDYRKMI